MPAVASTVPKRAVNSTPASPASAPETTNAAVTRRSIRTPTNRAAVGFDPMAYISRPERRSRVHSPTTTTTTSAMRASSGTPSTVAVPISRKESGSVSAFTWLPWVQRKARHDLLLVAAGEEVHRIPQPVVLELKPGGPLGGETALAAGAEQPERATAP